MSSKAKVLIVAIVLIAVVLVAAVYFFYFQEEKTEALPPHAKNRIIVQFKESAEPNIKKEETISGPDVGVSSVTEKNQKENVKEIKKLTPLEEGDAVKGEETDDAIDRLYTIEFKEEKNIRKTVEEYNNDPNIEFAEPDIEISTQVEPNDPYYYSNGSWGQSYADLWGIHKIDSANAWDLTTGSDSIVVAVIDTGVDYNHQDLNGNVWTNADEIPGNGQDDDNNGYVDDYYGYDFYNNDSNPIDDHAHGTHCAGTIAATGNNGMGVVGVNWSTKIMAVKFLSSGGSGYYSDALSSIYYAVDNGADILSNSWGGGGRYSAMQTAIDYAYNHGVVFVAAAGNSNSDAYYFTPAGLDHVVTVAATDHQDNKASFSSWGDVVELSAPGVDILSLKASGTSRCSAIGGNYCRMSGTSMATPHTAGLAALILSKDPTLSPDEVLELMEMGADDLGSDGKDIYFGYGRINSFGSLTAGVTHVDGTIIKPRNKSAIYKLQDGKKKKFTSGEVYESWYKWSDYISVSSFEANGYEADNSMKFRQGTLVRQSGKSKVYVIDGDSKLPIASGSVFNQLGYKWSNVVNTTSSEINRYGTGNCVSSSASHVDGTLVRARGRASTYLLDDGQKRIIPNSQVFNSRYKWKDIVEISSSELNGYQSGLRVGFREGAVVQARYHPEIYVIDGSSKRKIPSMAVFSALRYSWSKVILTSSNELSKYSTGQSISL